MGLKTTIEGGIKAAMLARDQDRLRTLRALKALILLEETSGNSTGEMSDDTEMKILTKAAKQRRDSLEIYIQQNRPDLAQKEQVELIIIEEFLPKQLSENDLRVKIQEIMTRIGASTAAEMGKVMGVASKELAGQAEGKAISVMVKSLLK